MSKIQFRNAAHRDFVLENLDKCKVNDCYHRAFFYVMGISEETRMNIGKMFDFKRDCIIPEGMHGGWQTSGTVKVCHLAFNLWNGFTEEGRESYKQNAGAIHVNFFFDAILQNEEGKHVLYQDLRDIFDKEAVSYLKGEKTLDQTMKDYLKERNNLNRN